MSQSHIESALITPANLMKQKWSVYISAAMVILSIILFGNLLVFDTVPLIGYALLISLWIGKSLLSGHFSYSTPLDFCILGLLLLLPAGLTLSHARNLSLVKIHGVLLCVVFFYLLVNYLVNLKRLKWSILLLIAMAFFFSILAFFGANWTTGDSTLPDKILSILPLPLAAIRQFTASGGIHVNTIGGTLTLFVPLLVSLFFDKGAYKRAFLRKNPRAKSMQAIYKIILATAIILVLFVLILTQSRGAILGAMFGILVLLVFKDRRFLLLIPLLVLALIVGIMVFADGDAARFLLLLDTYSNPEGDTLQTRIEYWKNTVYLIQDFPITGTGIGTYGKVFHDIYSFATPLATVRPLFYAHNMYLAVAADMGLPALVLYLALFSAFFTMVFYAIRKARSIVKTLLRGLLSGMAAHMVYGLMDNYMLGEKLGLSVWIFFGICSAVYLHRENLIHYYSQSPEKPPKTNFFSSRRKIWSRAQGLLWGLAAWLASSLIGISFININPFISLGVTVTGGILMGFFTIRRFELQYHPQQVFADVQSSD